MFQVIHHTDPEIAVELREAIVLHFGIAPKWLQAAIDWSCSTPEHHTYAIFFDRAGCHQNYILHMGQPPGDKTVELPIEPPDSDILRLFIRAFEHGRRMLGKPPSTDMIKMFFAGFHLGTS
jgi:hypothetical protein